MKKRCYWEIKTFAIVIGFFSSVIFGSNFSTLMAQELSPKYKAEVPPSILTPDTVNTKLLGNLEFFDGMPSKATVTKSYDFIDLARGT